MQGKGVKNEECRRLWNTRKGLIELKALKERKEIKGEVTLLFEHTQQLPKIK